MSIPLEQGESTPVEMETSGLLRLCRRRLSSVGEAGKFLGFISRIPAVFSRWVVQLVCPLPLQPGMLQGCNGQTSLFVVGIGVKVAQLPLEQLEEGRYLHPQPMPFFGFIV